MYLNNGNIDLYDRKVIGWAMSETMRAKDTSIAALKMALIHNPLQNTQELIFHSDRGVQYACTEFVNEVQKQKSITIRLPIVLKDVFL